MVASVILLGPGSLGLLSSQRAGRKRMKTNPQSARITRGSSQGVEFGIGINLPLASFIVEIVYIIVSSAVVKGFFPPVLFVSGSPSNA